MGVHEDVYQFYLHVTWHVFIKCIFPVLWVNLNDAQVILGELKRCRLSLILNDLQSSATLFCPDQTFINVDLKIFHEDNLTEPTNVVTANKVNMRINNYLQFYYLRVMFCTLFVESRQEL